MSNDIELMNLHHVAFALGKTVEEIGDLSMSSYYRWVAFLDAKVKAQKRG